MFFLKPGGLLAAEIWKYFQLVTRWYFLGRPCQILASIGAVLLKSAAPCICDAHLSIAQA